MKRTLYEDLAHWKQSKRRKPLLLRGARQTGKTFLLRQFGGREFNKIAYFDFERDPRLSSIFDADLDPHRIVSDLEIYTGIKIRAKHDLIVFDEIQASNRALASLKYFNDQAPEYHIAGAGSLLGISLSQPASFPVGKVSFLDLRPMSFLEFLEAIGKSQFAKLLDMPDEISPFPEAIHQELIDRLREYFFVGGMPEAVRSFVEDGDAQAVQQIHNEILDSYTLDFAKHAPSRDIPKLRLIWESIPKHLGKENKKFMFSAVRRGGRAREYESALRWLEDAGLVHLCHAVTSSRTPLKHHADRNIFKVYPLDIGLMGAMVHVQPQAMIDGDAVFAEYRGALTESYFSQQQVAIGHKDLFYWRSSGGKAEVDFLLEQQGSVVPIEVKSGVNLRSKSLKSYSNQFDPEISVRASLRNLKIDGRICNIPLYAVEALPLLIRIATQR